MSSIERWFGACGYLVAERSTIVHVNLDLINSGLQNSKIHD